MSPPDRSPGPRLTTSMALAVTGGRGDLLRIVLTALSSAATTVLLLLIVSVASIGPDNGPYAINVLNEPGLRPGVIVVLALLCVPVLVLAGQCARVGAPARDRRLASLRMAGGTPGEIRRIVALETGLAAALGAVLGAVAFLAGRGSLSPGRTAAVKISHDTVGSNGETMRITETVTTIVNSLPMDVTLTWWSILLVVLAVPVAAAGASVAALHRISISPFGVLHHRSLRPPALLPAVVFVAGVLGLAAWSPVSAWLGLNLADGLGPYAGVALLLFVLSLAGLVFGSASFAYLIGRLLAPRAGRPALLIAARRMVDAPFTASRTSSAVVFAVMLGAAVQGARVNFLLVTRPGDHFFADTFALLNLVLMVGIGIAVVGLLVIAAEGIIARRRTLAGLAAAGAPRRVLAEATLLETVLPLLPTVLLATAAGLLGARGFFGTRVFPPTSGDVTGPDVGAAVAVPVPWGELAVLAGGTLLAVVLVTALALVFLRRATSVTELRAAA